MEDCCTCLFFGADVWEGQRAWPLQAMFVFVLGAVIGSFLNVCIYRIPLDRSLWSPPSSCAACGTPLRWHEKIPILSWWWQRGRCACRLVRVDYRYWVVELMTGLLFLCLFWRYGRDLPLFGTYAFFVSVLIVGSGIDLDHYMIPFSCTLGLAAVGIVVSALLPGLHGEVTMWGGFKASLWGAFLSALVLFVIAEVGSKIFKKEAMGQGDIYFIAGLGAFLGAHSVFWVIPISSLLGAIYGLFLIIGKQGTWVSRVPYGPFLAGAAVLWLLGGDLFTEAYLEEIYQTFSDPHLLGGKGVRILFVI